MSVFQELISRLILDPTAYEAGAHAVTHAAHESMHAIDELVLHSKEAGAKMSESLKIGEILAPLAAVASAAGIIELGKEAWKTAREFDALERKLIGVTQSAERAKEIMEFSEHLSGLYGIAKPQELDAVATQLERLKLKTEDYLPVIQMLAVMAPQGASAMTEFAEAFALIEQGQGGRAIRQLERIGITIKDLERHGLRFSGLDEQTGMRQLVTPPKQALAGIKATIEDVGGPELKAQLNSPDAIAQRFENAWDRAMRGAGQAIRADFLPSIEAVTRVVDDENESGAIKRLTDGFLGLLGLRAGNLEGTLLRLSDFVEEIPNKVLEAKNAFLDWLPTITTVAEALATAWAIGKVIEFGSAVVGVYGKVTKAIAGVTAWITAQAAAEEAASAANAADTATLTSLFAAELAVAEGAAAAAGAVITLESALGFGLVAVGALAIGAAAFIAIKGMVDDATKSVTDFTSAVNGVHGKNESAETRALERKLADLRKKRDEEQEYLADDGMDEEDQASNLKPYDDAIKDNEAQLKKSRANDAAGLAVKEDAEKKAKEDAANTNAPVNSLLRQIVQNTGATAESLKRFALGGGDLGKLGVAAVDMPGRHSTGTAGRLFAAINDHISSEFNRMQGGLMRQGITQR